MMQFEEQYLYLLNRVLRDGEKREDRTGTGTFSLFGEQLKFDVKKDGFPLLTTKKMPFRAILSELIWFLEGSNDERRLAQILHGSSAPEFKTIWSPNAENTTGSNYVPRFKGDLGNIYGVQWRKWKKYDVKKTMMEVKHFNGSSTFLGSKVTVSSVDQLRDVVDRIKNNPTDRRLIVSAWNPGDLENMMLPPCHMMFQFYVRQGKFLDLQMYQRSVDTFLGLPFNMASYALLMYIVGNEVGLTPGILTMALGDTHIYLDHVEQVKTQLNREQDKFPPCVVTLAKEASIDNISMDMVHLAYYQSFGPIVAKMSA